MPEKETVCEGDYNVHRVSGYKGDIAVDYLLVVEDSILHPFSYTNLELSLEGISCLRLAFMILSQKNVLLWKRPYTLPPSCICSAVTNTCQSAPREAVFPPVNCAFGPVLPELARASQVAQVTAFKPIASFPPPLQPPSIPPFNHFPAPPLLLHLPVPPAQCPLSC